MKALIPVAIFSSLLGILLGGAIAYVETRPPETEKGQRDQVASASSRKRPSPRTTQPAHGPKVVIPEETFEFGAMEHRATRRHNFTIRNEGDQDLVVTFVSSTCNCTRVELGGKLAEKGVTVSVAPGSETTVMLEWTAKVASGPYRHGAYFDTNDPRRPKIGLSVAGEVQESTSLRPTELQFGSMRLEEKKEIFMYLLSLDGQPVQVLHHEVLGESLKEHLHLRFETLSPDDLPDPKATGGVRIVASYLPAGALGPISGSLRMETTLPNTPVITVPILGWVQGDISVYGAGWVAKTATLEMGTISSKLGKKIRLVLAVRGPHAQETHFEVGESDPPELKATLGETRKMGDQLFHIPLHVEIPAGTRPMVRLGEPLSRDATILLHTTHPVSKEVRIRVHFAVGP